VNFCFIFFDYNFFIFLLLLFVPEHQMILIHYCQSVFVLSEHLGFHFHICHYQPILLFFFLVVVWRVADTQRIAALVEVIRTIRRWNRKLRRAAKLGACRRWQGAFLALSPLFFCFVCDVCTSLCCADLQSFSNSCSRPVITRSSDLLSSLRWYQNLICCRVLQVYSIAAAPRSQ
jgi:hypothetical protein